MLTLSSLQTTESRSPVPTCRDTSRATLFAMRRQVKRKLSESDEMAKIAGSLNDPMNLNGLSTDDVESKVGFNHEDSIAIIPKFWMMGYSTKMRIIFKKPDTVFELFNKLQCTTRTVLCNEIENG